MASTAIEYHKELIKRLRETVNGQLLMKGGDFNEVVREIEAAFHALDVVRTDAKSGKENK